MRDETAETEYENDVADIRTDDISDRNIIMSGQGGVETHEQFRGARADGHDRCADRDRAHADSVCDEGRGRNEHVAAQVEERATGKDGEG